MLAVVPAAVALQPASHRAGGVRAASPRCSLSVETDRTTLGTLSISGLGVGMLNFPLDVEEDEDTAAAFTALTQSGCNVSHTGSTMYSLLLPDRLLCTLRSSSTLLKAIHH